MKQILGGLLILVAIGASAAVRYVDVNSSNPTPPFTDWSTAATSIQDAVNAADPQDLVLVTNGVYRTGQISVYGGTYRVAVTNQLTLRSVEGPAFTVIEATNGMRGVGVADSAVLSGFTVTAGADGIHGGSQAVVSNCVVAGNRIVGIRGCLVLNCVISNNASTGVGFSSVYGSTITHNKAGGVGKSELWNCVISDNTSSGFGSGGATECVLNDCIISNNVYFDPRWSEAGGVGSSQLTNCIIINNYSKTKGGATDSTLVRCAIIGNVATNQFEFYLGGGASYSTLIDCVVAGNIAAGYYGQGSGGLIFCTAINCTIVRNSSSGVSESFLTNCIVYHNELQNYDTKWPIILDHCCTTPLPTNGVGNITNDPLFVDLAGGNLRLQNNSPCVNAGRNTAMPAGPDLDGNPRLAGGTVDIGAYEFQSPTSTLSYAWLLQHGLSNDGSADHADIDGDGHDNWQEWKAGTAPTDPASVLKLLRPEPNPAGLLITWQSAGDRRYAIERSDDLTIEPAFETVRNNIPGQAGTTSYLDTNAVGSGPFFYRVQVKAQ